MKKMKNNHKPRSGFTIIELLIVIMIIGVLVGVAVPYYNDYIYDSRLSVLKQNLATMRNVINQFRGDRGRGPFRVEVYDSGTLKHIPFNSDKSIGSELVAGAFVSDKSRHIKYSYLKSIPKFIDPNNGSEINNTISPSGTTAYFVDDGATPNAFDIDTEFAFIDGDNNGTFENGDYDLPLYNYGVLPADGTAGVALDYLDFTVTASDGTVY